MKYYRAAHLITPSSDRQGHVLAVEQGKIQGIYSPEDVEGPVEDLGEGTLCPGFFDTHIHGYGDADVMDHRAQSLRTMCARLPETGVTSFLATTLTASAEEIASVCRVVRAVYEEKPPGAKIQGIFLEGPFFNEAYRGAQNPAYMGAPDLALLQRWQEAAGGLIRKIAIAPELPGSVEFIRGAREMGVYVAIGHTAATYEQCMDAVDAGATLFVHCYNAMTPFHHRNPGVVGAALELSSATAECIADGFHSHPASVRLLFRSRGAEQVALITDCMRAGGMPDGDYTLGEFPVKVKEGAARLENGSLAGSILQMRQAVANVTKWGAATAAQAIRSASQVPAASVGLNTVGALRVGAPADFLYLSPQGELEGVWIDGEKYPLPAQPETL